MVDPSLPQLYRYLSAAIASRRAAQVGDAHKAFGGPYAHAAYALSRAGFADGCITSTANGHSLCGAVDGAHAGLAQFLADQFINVHSVLRQRCTWRASELGLKIHFGPKFAAVALAAAGNYRAAETAAFDCYHQDILEIRRWRQIRTEAARHGDARALRWAFSQIRVPGECLDEEAANALAYALAAGRGCPSVLTRLVSGKSCVHIRQQLLHAACEGGNVKGAAALLRILAKAAPERSATDAELLIAWACRMPSLRILALTISRAGRPMALLEGIRMRCRGIGCGSLDPYTSDARLADAQACVEFILLYTHVPRFNRGRLLAFHAPRRTLRLRATPCLTTVVASRFACP